MRPITRLATFLFCSLLVGTSAIAQDLYKSIGPDGRVIYSDKPPAGARVEKTLKFENLPSSALPASASSYVEQLRKLKASSPAIAASGAVVLYSAAWCGYCKKAKAYLAEKGISYQEVDIDTDEGVAAFAQAGGGKGVPLLLAGGQRVQGFSPEAYDALFAKRK